MFNKHDADVEVKTKDFILKYKGSALCFLIFTCICAIVISAIYVTDSTIKFSTILMLFAGLIMLIRVFESVVQSDK